MCNKKLLVLNNLQCHYYEYSNKRKSTARLGRLTAPRGARPRSFHHEAMLHDEKSPTTFPLTLCTTVKIDIPSSYLFLIKKTEF